jgi:UPF0716 family protein affecting phage T7 exclusion
VAGAWSRQNALSGLGIGVVFGLGVIVWFAWVGVVLLRDDGVRRRRTIGRLATHR